MRIVEDYLEIKPGKWFTKKLDLDNNVHKVRYVARYRYAFPGGYELCIIANDGALICQKCVRENYRTIIKDTKDNIDSGWRCVGIEHEMNMENENCAHCGKPLGYVIDTELDKTLNEICNYKGWK